MKGLFKKIAALALVGAMAVTAINFSAFAADEEETDPVTGIVWINGKDVKANADKKIEADYNKTCVIGLSTIAKSNTDVVTTFTKGSPTTPVNLKIGTTSNFVVSVTETTVTKVADAFTDKGKGKTADYAKAAYKKATDINNATIVLTAGKKIGSYKVWVAEIDKKSSAIISYSVFESTAKAAPAKLDIYGSYVAGEDEKGQDITVGASKKMTANIGTEVTLIAACSKTTANNDPVDASSTYTWSVKSGAKFIDIDLEATGNTNTVTLVNTDASKPGKTAKAVVEVINNESRKKASYTFTISNDLININFEERGSLTGCAFDTNNKTVANKYITLMCNFESILGSELSSATDKVAFYVTDKTATGEGYSTGTATKPKFSLTSKSAVASAKFDKDNGIVKVTVKKGTLSGTSFKVLAVVTHADKSIDVYETEAYTVLGGVYYSTSLSNPTVTVTPTYGNYIAAGVETTFKAAEGEKALKSITYTINVDGEDVEKTVNAADGVVKITLPAIEGTSMVELDYTFVS